MLYQIQVRLKWQGRSYQQTHRSQTIWPWSFYNTEQYVLANSTKRTKQDSSNFCRLFLCFLWLQHPQFYSSLQPLWTAFTFIKKKEKKNDGQTVYQSITFVHGIHICTLYKRTKLLILSYERQCIGYVKSPSTPVTLYLKLDSPNNDKGKLQR